METATLDRAAKAVPLIQAWKLADEARNNFFEPAAAQAERAILTALNHAHRAGMILLVDDLTSALSHVDGCAAAYETERRRRSEASHDARVAVIAAGFGCFEYEAIEGLIDLCHGRPDLEAFLSKQLDFINEMAE
jgi:hypothetical protein